MLERLRKKVLKKKKLSRKEVNELAYLDESKLMKILLVAEEIKRKYIGKTVDLCSIVNARSGNCSENCSFCPQSIHNRAEVKTYPLISEEEIMKKALIMEEKGADHFGVVISGHSADEREFNRILKICNKLKEQTSLNICVSLGILTQKKANKLAEAGIDRYNHNLETSENYFNSICTSHSYQQRINTIKNLKNAEVEVCSGGIIGLGEKIDDRIELAFKLRQLEVDTISLNILNPVSGTPLENQKPLKPVEILKTIAFFRFINPDKPIKICGGRERNLRDLQSMIFMAGGSGLLIGNYLTTEGRSCKEDTRMIKDLGLEMRANV